MNRWWKGLVFLLLVLSLFTTWMQLANLQRFMNQGPRFTAKDGQELCERVKALESELYRYLDVGKHVYSCEYIRR